MTDPATKLMTFVDCVQKAAAIAVHQKVCIKNEITWMNAELKTLMQESNRLRRDMGVNRDAWVAKTREVLEKTQEAKRSTWRTYLEDVTRTKVNALNSASNVHHYYKNSATEASRDPYERRQESLGSCEEPEWVGAGPGCENPSSQRP